MASNADNIPDFAQAQLTFLREADLGDEATREGLIEMIEEGNLSLTDAVVLINRINPNDPDQFLVLLATLTEEVLDKLPPHYFELLAAKIDPNTNTGSYVALLLIDEGKITEATFAAIKERIIFEAVNLEEPAGHFGTVVSNLTDAKLITFRPSPPAIPDLADQLARIGGMN